MNKKFDEALKLANKIYLNSYGCMWNDMMIHLHKNNFFYFYNQDIIEKTTEIGQKEIRKSSEQLLWN